MSRQTVSRLAAMAMVLLAMLAGYFLYRNHTRPQTATSTATPMPTPIVTPVPTPVPTATSAPVLYAYSPKEQVTYRGRTYTDELVDVRRFVPQVQIDLMYAGPDNFMQTVLYEREVCMLQLGTAQKLAKAQERFLADGYSLIIYDGYRPLSVQEKMHETIADTRYIAAPPSNHNRGASVDVALVDREGNVLEFPSEVDTFTSAAHRNLPDLSRYQKGTAAYEKLLRQYPDLESLPPRTDAAIQNMQYLTEVMVACGFQPIETEWWHFTDTDVAQYPPTDRVFDTFVYSTSPDGVEQNTMPSALMDGVRETPATTAPTSTPGA